MRYAVTVGSFEKARYSVEVRAILASSDGSEKETHFDKIAVPILVDEGFENVVSGPSVLELQGVPFDFIAIENGTLALIELKGSKDTFNYSSHVQFARLHHVVGELKSRGIDCSTYLLQINLEYALYQILGADFYSMIFNRIDEALGRVRPIAPIVDEIITRMRKNGVELER